MTVRQFAMLGVFLITAALVTALYLVIPAAPRIGGGFAKYSPITGEVEAGFVGIVNFGHWRLICDPASDKIQSARKKISAASIRKSPPRIAPTKSSSPPICAPRARAEHAALALRLPPTAHVGDKIVLRFGDHVLKCRCTNVRPSQCLARTRTRQRQLERIAGRRRG